MSTKLLLLIVPPIAIATGLAGWAVHVRHMANLQEKLTQRARSLYTQIMAERQYYASVIVPRVQELGGTLGTDYQQVHGRFPLPATMVREVSARTAAVREGFAADLISPWPINPVKGVREQFQRDAFTELMKDPTRPFVRTDTIEGQVVMRVLMADRATAQSCVDCHNTHPKSPKRDFRLNDVMGGLEIVIPMEGYLAESRRDVLLTVAGGTALCAMILGIVILGTRAVVVRPLGRLAEKMRALAGIRDSLAPRSFGDEVQEVTAVFEWMQSVIAGQQQELHEAAAQLEHRVAEQTRALQGVVETTRHLSTESRLTPLLQQVTEAARRLTGASYAALAVFDDTGRLAQFVTTGMEEATKRAIGIQPTGRGLLGYLAHEEGVLRLKDLTQHPAAVGFPPHHPPMRSFLGVSIRAHGRTFGRLYLTNKQGADEFTDMDETVIANLAGHAGVAIQNALLLRNLQTSRRQFRDTMASLPVAVVRVGRDGTIRFANPSFGELVHRAVAELVGQSLVAVFPVEELAEWLRAGYPGGGVPRECEVEWRGAPGGSRILRVIKSGLRRADDDDDDNLLVIEDLTDRRQLEVQLQQAQKMEVVGRLAGGIAHDFNNLLTVINGYSELLLGVIAPSDPTRPHVEQIRQAGQRAATFTNQLLAFSRKQVLQPKVLDLNARVIALVPMLRRLLGEDIEVATVLEEGPGQIKVDPGQLDQVVMNLAVNARDAMPHGGTLMIASASVTVEHLHVVGATQIPPGSYVVLTVRDTGCGMDAETQARIFEPFFTTKEPGKGTGLGLAMVYGFMKQSGGFIMVESAPGRGATFSLYFPRAEEDPVPSQASPEPPTLARGSEVILLVEDDEGVRGLARTFLQRGGYLVLEARNGEEALRLSTAYRGRITLLVTDLIMPGLSGRELAERLAAARPEMQVLYVSGYTADVLVHHDAGKDEIALLEKPYSAEALLRKVREVLDARRG